jgi:CIC family chloride channel protein
MRRLFRRLFKLLSFLRRRLLPRRSWLSTLVPSDAPLDLRILGRTLLHAALVGAAAGLLGAAFFYGLELMQHYLLERLCGYSPLRAHGEYVVPLSHGAPRFRPWLLVLLPALGGLLSGLITARFATEAQGGGGDAMIEAYHRASGHVRARVIWVKALASLLTLGTGGSGGREGPTMQIGSAIGATVARLLNLDERERRILFVAGVAAGISAVFRTPLGAALLAVEILYRDDFEADALIPAILGSVVAYSVVTSIYGETQLLAHAPRYPFVPVHLPLYVALALLVSVLAVAFLSMLRFVQRNIRRLPGPLWLRPAAGGMLLGVLFTPVVMLFGSHLHQPGQGLGIFGGGYGAAQIAVLGASWLPGGWLEVTLLLLLCAAKLLSSSLTIGSGGSAGDFAPSLVLGGLLGGAFGRALQLLLNDPRIDPGAFALVGIGTFYGGVAHVPLSALVITCELAGSYDLLVPLMLAEGVAFVALRRWSLYPAQPPSKRETMHPGEQLDVLSRVKVKDAMRSSRPCVSFQPDTPAPEILRRLGDSEGQESFPVLSSDGRLVGLIVSEDLLLLASQPDHAAWTIATDIMRPPASLSPEDDLRHASRLMVQRGLREVPVLEPAPYDQPSQPDVANLAIRGFLTEADIAAVYLEQTSQSKPVA